MTRFSVLRIGLIGPLPPPAGGMANQTRQLRELLREAGAEVTLVQTNAPHRPTWIEHWPFLRAVARLIPYIACLWRTAGRVDIFHVMANSGWSWHLLAAPAIWIASMRSVPVLVNYRGGEAAAFLARWKYVVRWSLRRVKKIIVPSGFLVDVFGRHGIRCHIVPNIVDLSLFAPRSMRVSNDLHVVVARNLEPIYDNATAIRAIGIVHAELPQARMTIAGSGPEFAKLQAQAAEAGMTDAVTFSGRLDPQGMAALYRSADVVLNPSLADNMPNSILEAMASGVPVVSTRVGGVPFMVEDGRTALLVEAGDAEAMAIAILRLAKQKPLWCTLHSAGIAEAQRYTWQRVAPVLLGAYCAIRSPSVPSVAGS